MKRALLVGVVLGLALAGPAEAAPLLKTTVNTARKGPRLPRAFLGVSQEYEQIEAYTGVPRKGTNTSVAALLRRLSELVGRPVVLRVGGGSTDGTWVNPGVPKPPNGIYFNVYPRTLAGLSAFAEQADARLIMGLNLGLNDRSLLLDEARAFVAGLPASRLLGLEVGNEPNGYAQRPLYQRANGKTVYTRPKGYGPRKYARELGAVLPALDRSTGATPLLGPSIDLDGRWVRALPRLLRRQGKRLDGVTAHTYLLSGCEKQRRSPRYPTVGRLASAEAFQRQFVELRPVTAVARQARRSLRLSETNSVACGGRDRVSNTGAAGLWTLDFLYGAWLSRIAGVNLHSASATYRPIGQVRLPDGTFAAQAGPGYYAMLAFAESVQGGSRLLLTPPFGEKVRRGANIHAWATLDDRRRVVRVMVVNKDRRASGPVLIRVPRARGAGSVVRLATRGLAARSGISWAGQSFGSVTTGTPIGERTEQRVRQRPRDRFRFRVGPASAALLTVRVGG